MLGALGPMDYNYQEAMGHCLMPVGTCKLYVCAILKTGADTDIGQEITKEEKAEPKAMIPTILQS